MEFPLFLFLHISSPFFLANSLFLYAFAPPNHSFRSILEGSCSSEKLDQNNHWSYELSEKRFSPQIIAWFLSFILFKPHISLCILFPFPKLTTASSHHEATEMGNAADCCRHSLGTGMNQHTDALSCSQCA